MTGDQLQEMDTEGGVEPDGDHVGAGSVPQDTGHLHMDSRFFDKRRRGPQGDGRLVTGQDGFMEITEKTPPNEYGHFPI